MTDSNINEIDPKLLEVLVCPLNRTRLIYNKETQELISKSARLAYPIHNGVPIMLEAQARELAADEKY